MCKKNELNVETLNAMAIGTDFFKLNHDFNFVEVGDYQGQSALIDLRQLHITF